MIERMQKASVLLLDSRRTETLEQLRELGVLHVESRPGESESLERLYGQHKAVEQALRTLEQYAPEAMNREKAPSTVTEKVRDEALDRAEEINRLDEQYRQYAEQIEQLQREWEATEPWGEFDPQELEGLAGHGVRIRFHVMNRKSFQKEGPAGAYLIATREAKAYFVTLDRTTDRAGTAAEQLGEFAETEVQPPQRALPEIERDLQEKQGAQSECVQKMQQAAADTGTLELVRELLTEQIEFHEVNEGLGQDERICHVTGFIPVSQVETLRETARSNGWGLLLREPEKDEHVPTRVKNPKPVRIINPVFNLLETIPGYREYDISFWFLLFFAVFVAIIIGDAAYGIIVLGLSGFLMSRSKEGVQPGHVLLTVLGGCTVIWGAMTGTWFGYEPFSNAPLLSSFVVEPISSYNPASEQNVMWLCFILATIHLAIAHLWAFGRYIKDGEALLGVSHLGWLSLVLGLYYLVLNVVLGQPMPGYSIYMMGGGFLGVVIFGQQESGQSFLQGVGRGVANLFPTALDSISAFSDIISYIRLFAVGLATLAIAQSFNDMALGLAAGAGIGGIIGSVLVLFVGHTLNLLMAALAVIVHGVRLNMLEFSRHLGMEWSGTEYDPFRKRIASGQ
jgi:V/A-type H+-transporting ATPase subunit I